MEAGPQEEEIDSEEEGHANGETESAERES